MHGTASLVLQPRVRLSAHAVLIHGRLGMCCARYPTRDLHVTAPRGCRPSPTTHFAPIKIVLSVNASFHLPGTLSLSWYSRSSLA
eukprot:902611-Rhodomonas_salina.1